MNNKAQHLYKIVEIVVNCCATEIDEEGHLSVTIEDVLGKSRCENIVMTRCICAMLLVGEGYSVTTIAQLLGRSPHAVRHLLDVCKDYYQTSRAFRIATAEATLMIRDMVQNK